MSIEEFRLSSVYAAVEASGSPFHCPYFPCKNQCTIGWTHQHSEFLPVRFTVELTHQHGEQVLMWKRMSSTAVAAAAATAAVALLHCAFWWWHRDEREGEPRLYPLPWHLDGWETTPSVLSHYLGSHMALGTQCGHLHYGERTLGVLSLLHKHTVSYVFLLIAWFCTLFLQKTQEKLNIFCYLDFQRL